MILTFEMQKGTPLSQPLKVELPITLKERKLHLFTPNFLNVDCSHLCCSPPTAPTLSRHRSMLHATQPTTLSWLQSRLCAGPQAATGCSSSDQHFTQSFCFTNELAAPTVFARICLVPARGSLARLEQLRPGWHGCEGWIPAQKPRTSLHLGAWHACTNTCRHWAAFAKQPASSMPEETLCHLMEPECKHPIRTSITTP